MCHSPWSLLIEFLEGQVWQTSLEKLYSFLTDLSFGFVMLGNLTDISLGPAHGTLQIFLLQQ